MSFKYHYPALSNCDWWEANCLSPTVQLDFSWSLKISDQQNDWFARPSEYMGSSQSAAWHHLAVVSNQFFPNDSFSKITIKNINNDFDKIRIRESETRSPLPTVELEFSWTLEMSDRQSDLFARLFESLKICVSPLYIDKNSIIEFFCKSNTFRN